MMWGRNVLEVRLRSKVKQFVFRSSCEGDTIVSTSEV